jgi:lipoprotein-releasing system permease protein
LRSKVFAYFGVICVALSVCLMLIAVSVFTGFLNKIERAAKGLFGDIVIEAAGARGLARYDEFIAEVKQKVPEVEAADPFILSLGMLGVEGDKDFFQHVQIAGIRLPSRADVTDFEEGLFIQKGSTQPTFTPPLQEAIKRIEQHQDQMREILKREFAPQLQELTDQQRKACLTNWTAIGPYLWREGMDTEHSRLLRRLTNAGLLQEDALRALHRAIGAETKLKTLRDELAAAKKRGATETELDELQQHIDDLIDQTRVELPAYRAILGLGIPGLSFRTSQGETIRYLVPGHRVILHIAPLGKRISLANPTLNVRKFTVIDDNRSDVSSIDKKLVYVPFATLQRLNNMSADVDADTGEEVSPARCSQIHIKVRGQDLSERQLRQVAEKVDTVWEDFHKRRPDAALSDVGVETWRQRQAALVEPIEKQRTLVVIVIAVMWIVVVVLIFVIFYTIVTQKTQEIGVLKSVGASGGGVVAIFLGYGAIVGAVGSGLGVIGGYFFVKNINFIQDWVDSQFGYRVWSREQFMFEFIPNQVDWSAAWMIVVGSIIAGLVGALWPAIRAGRMQPVEALRYE